MIYINTEKGEGGGGAGKNIHHHAHTHKRQEHQQKKKKKMLNLNTLLQRDVSQDLLRGESREIYGQGEGAGRRGSG